MNIGDDIPQPRVIAKHIGTSQCPKCDRVCKSREAYRKHYVAEHLLQPET